MHAGASRSPTFAELAVLNAALAEQAREALRHLDAIPFESAFVHRNLQVTIGAVVSIAESDAALCRRLAALTGEL